MGVPPLAHPCLCVGVPLLLDYIYGRYILSAICCRLLLLG